MADANELQNQIQVALELPPESKFYVNGFTIAMTPTDVVIVLLQNNKPIALLNTPPIIAKALTASLDGLVKDYETKTGQRVLTLDEINSALSK